MRKINMCGDILQTGKLKRIGMGKVAVVAHQRAGIALRMIKLGAAKPVIDQQHRTFFQRLRQTGDEATDSGGDLAEVIVNWRIA